MLYPILGIVIFSLAVLILGLLLPEKRIATKQAVYDAPTETVYSIAINNRDWKHRTSLEDFRTIETKGDFEVWEETSQGYTIRFKTKEKRPFAFYSIEMDSTFFQGEWLAEFELIEDGETLFTATEVITYKNPLARVIGYAFMDLGGLMEKYQSELENKI